MSKTSHHCIAVGLHYIQAFYNLAQVFILLVNAKLPGRRAQAESAIHLPVDDSLHKSAIEIVLVLENILTLCQK